MLTANLNFDKLQLHAGEVVKPSTGSRAVPINQITSYVFLSSRAWYSVAEYVPAIAKRF